MANCFVCKSGDYIVRSPMPDVMIPNRSLPEFTWRNLETYAGYPALACGVSGRSYTYKEARDLSRRFGAALLEKGFQPGDVLAVMSHNIPEYPLILLGALEAGLIATTITSTYNKHEISNTIRATSPKIMLTLPSLVPLVKGVLEQLETRIPIIAVSYDEPKLIGEGLWDFEDMIRGQAELESSRKAQPEDIAFLMSTSGTTGTSKVVTWTHRNLIAFFVPEFKIESNPEGNSKQVNYFTMTEDQIVVPIALTPGSTYMILCVLGRLAANAHIIFLPKWKPRTFLSIISNQKPLTLDFVGKPGMIFDVQSMAETEDLKSVRTVITSGDFMISSHMKNLFDKMPNRNNVLCINGFSSTETMTSCVALVDDTCCNPEIIGVPYPNIQVKIVSPAGKSLGPGEEGEMYVKGPQVTKGYLNNDTANAEAFEEDGWFKTGDLAYYDKNNRIYLKGRLKDIIKVDAMTISPAELEELLLRHPCVGEAAVIGAPADTGIGETPVAFVVPKPGAQLDCEKVSEFVAEQVAPHKRLSKIIVRASLPRNANGKIRKNILKEDYLKSV